MIFKNAQERRAAELRFIEKICIWLDDKYLIPGTKFKYGVDPLIGLVPFLGHAVTFVISGALVLLMLRHGGSGKLAVKMTLNVMVDTVIGAIPVFGNIFDFAYKANIRNVRLLKEHYEKDKHKGTGVGIIVTVLITMLLLLIAVVVLFVWGIGKILELL